MLLKVRPTDNDVLATKNLVYVSSTYVNEYCMIHDKVFRMKCDETNEGEIKISGKHRNMLKVSLNDNVDVRFYTDVLSVPNLHPIKKMTIFIRTDKTITFNCLDLSSEIKDNLRGTILNKNFDIIYISQSITQSLYSVILLPLYIETNTQDSLFGYITSYTQICFESTNNVTFLNNIHEEQKLFNNKINLSELGIGGMSDEFKQLFRRVFGTRILPKHVIKQLGINHVKGILLYGPPGCGKTLMARKIGKMLNINEKKIKIVLGPSLLNKFVGQSEENVRELFKDAIASSGKSDDLHLIICDEFDAIVKVRGSSKDGTGVGDNVVNQFLSMIDGPNQLDNILLICMTNRKDLIDPAILRAGRLEVHIEVRLPSLQDRAEILMVHTKKIIESGLMMSDIDLPYIVENTDNFTGAEIESLVKIAVSYSIDRCTDFNSTNGKIFTGEQNIKVRNDDFLRALEEIVPMFAKKDTILSKTLTTDFIMWDKSIEIYYNNIMKNIPLLKKGQKYIIQIHGSQGIGKTSFVFKLLRDTQEQSIRIIDSNKLQTVADKSQYIYSVYNECLKVNSSIIVFDNLERIIEYTKIGMRFNNTILQTILTILNNTIDINTRMTIILTSSDDDLISGLSIETNDYYVYPSYISKDKISDFGISITTDEPKIKINEVFKLLKFS